MSSISLVPSPGSRRSCTRRRVSGLMVVSRSCRGFISPRPLKRCTLTLPFFFSASMRSRMPCFSPRPGRRRPPCPRRCDTAAAWRRRRAGGHQRPEVAHEQGADQRRDVQAVGVGIGEDADLAVAQARQIVEPGRRRGDGDVVHLLGGEDLAGVHLPGVQDLAAQGQDRLELAVAGLLGAAAGGVALHQEQLGALRVLAGAVGELAGQGRPLR
jgi:hypothetical protein